MSQPEHKQLAVLMTGPLLTEQPGGIQTHVQNFIGAFSNSTTIDFRFFPVTLGLYDRESWARKAGRFVGSLWPFFQAARAVDAVHINSTFDNRSLIRDGVYLLLARWVARTPVVMQFHGGLPKHVRLTQTRLVARLFGVLLGWAAQVLVLSKVQSDQFAELFPRVRHAVVPNYIDCLQRSLRVTTELPTPMRFMFMGRLHAHKGIKEIVAASRMLADRGFKFEVNFCGDGPLRNWLQNEITELSRANPYLKYAGVAYGEKKEAALIAAAVMLLPSYAEGFPYALLEAATFSMPIIATPVGAIPDVIVNGRNGFMVPIRDVEALAAQMEFAIQNPAAIREMGACAQQQVATNFSIEKLRLTFEAIYQTTAGIP